MAFKLLLALAIINLVWSRARDVNVNVKVEIDVCCPGNCCPSQDQAAENILLPHLTSTTTEVTTTDRTTKTTDRTTTTPDRTTTQGLILWRDDFRCGANFPLPDGTPSQCNPSKGNGYCCSHVDWCGNLEDHCLCDECVNYIGYNAYIQQGMIWSESQCSPLGEKMNSSFASCIKRCDSTSVCTSIVHHIVWNDCRLYECPVTALEPTEEADFYYFVHFKVKK